MGCIHSFSNRVNNADNFANVCLILWSLFFHAISTFFIFFKSINTCTGIIVVGNTVLCKEQIKMSLFSWHWLQGYSKIHLDYRFSVFMDLKVNAQHLVFSDLPSH